MTLHNRSILDKDLNDLRTNILQMTSLVDTAIEQAMLALGQRDVVLAQKVISSDHQVNQLRYDVEEASLRILATQQPMASDLRVVIAVIHLAVELERIGDHAAGIARLVARLESEDEIDTLHKLPKMARRARQMLRESVDAFINKDAAAAKVMIGRDDKIDRQYNKLFQETLEEMQDDAYIRRATFLLWVGHNLERIGDRATNIAERVIFMTTGEFIETSTAMN
ncbi:MAG: phosphate signaling complex protein PhoU [Ardenticatenaceae bacterium]|nr:phosphate signaling complex protein PhoU [Ardenticatenaceae bacterium]MCB9446152.1 phosphate signaling complex protein PhoU [Ardenticatenaceae bacterium]